MSAKREMRRDERRVYRIVLRQASLRSRELPDAECVGVRDRDFELVQKGDQLELVPACGLDADRRLGLSREVADLPEARDAVVDFLRRRAHPFLVRRDEHVELFL